MTRLFDATCVADVVKVAGHTIPEAQILTQGTAASEGILLVSNNKVKYFTTHTTDIEDLLGEIADALGTIAGALSSITGSLSPPVPSLGAAVSSINAVASTLNTLKDNLK